MEGEVKKEWRAPLLLLPRPRPGTSEGAEEEKGEVEEVFKEEWRAPLLLLPCPRPLEGILRSDNEARWRRRYQFVAPQAGAWVGSAGLGCC